MIMNPADPFGNHASGGTLSVCGRRTTDSRPNITRGIEMKRAVLIRRLAGLLGALAVTAIAFTGVSAATAHPTTSAAAASVPGDDRWG